MAGRRLDPRCKLALFGDLIESKTESRCQMYRVPLFKPRRTDRRMFTSLMMLAAEANGVVALRMMKLMRGGKSARSEAELMVREKIDAALEATATFNGWRFGRENSPSAIENVLRRMRSG